MNKKVLKTMIALVVVFLTACYILKIFFPEQFVMAIENKVLINIGDYIDSHAWADYLFGIITSFITYWFYLCAVCHRWYLKWWHCLVVLGVIGATIGLTFVNYAVYTAFSIASFVILPFIFKSDLKSVAICYPVHLIAQGLTLAIRNLPVYLTHINNLIILAVGIESYLWLILFYFWFNDKEIKSKFNQEVTMGWKFPPLYGKKDKKYYDDKLAGVNGKIAKLEEEKAVYEAKIAEFDEPKTEVAKG